MSRLTYVFILSLLGIVIVHICTLFLVPHYARYNAWSQLQQNSQPYTFQSPASNNPIAKTSDPLVQMKTCYFNLIDGPVRISANGYIPFWSLSLYDHAGINIYSLNNRTAPNGMLDVVVSDPVQLIDFKQAMSGRDMNSILTGQNIENGFSVLRVFRPSPDWDKQVDAFLESANCKQAAY